MKYLTNSGLSYFLNKIKAYLTSSTYLNSIGIFPNNDNSVDLGASSKNIKMVYTKGITINGTQFLPSDYATLSGLSAVATSGSYNDLSNKPSIPSKTSDLTNDSGFLTSHQDLSGYIPLSGTNALAGSIIPDTDNAYNLGDSTHSFAKIFTQYVQGSNTIKELSLFSSNNVYDPWNHGAFLSLYANDYSAIPTRAGTFSLGARGSGDNWYNLIGTPNGTLTWGSKNVAMQEDTVPRTGGAVMTGNYIARTVDNDSLALLGSAGWKSGAVIIATGKDYPSPNAKSVIRMSCILNDTTEKNMWLRPDGTWTWDGTACQITSDQRLKQQITEIDDKLLDAWEDVNLVQFKYNDAVDQKGKDKARLHTGYVVQQIDEACQKHNIDISEYGLYCHEEYPQETEEVEVENEDGTKTKETKVIREASEHYSLRYTETLVVECAYLRKQIKELKERLEKLEGNSK